MIEAVSVENMCNFRANVKHAKYADESGISTSELHEKGQNRFKMHREVQFLEFRSVGVKIWEGWAVQDLNL